MRLRSYQKEIIAECIDNTTRDESTLVMLPTGSGKTVIAKAISSQYKKRVLFLAPKIELLKQTTETFAELNPQIIHKNTQYDNTKNVFVSTIQTITRRKELLAELKIDLIIIDEIHFGASGKMQEIIRECHGGHIIGLSATPYDANGVLLNGFDNIIDRFDIAYMVKNKFLCNIKAVSPLTIDLSGISTMTGDYNIKELDFKMNTTTMLKAVADASIGLIRKRKKTLIFAVSIAHAKALTKLYKTSGNLKVDVLHSELSEEKQKQVTDRFKHKDLDVLVSINMITTGFDSPNIDTIVIARPTKSQNLYKQMVGRAMRLHPDKREALLIDCGNVCTTLGKPLDPIKEKPLKVNERIYQCTICGSKKDRVKSYIDGILNTHCPECFGDQTPYVERAVSLVCSKCDGVNGTEKLVINRFGMFLDCDHCKKSSIIELFEDIEWGREETSLHKSILLDSIFSIVLSHKPIFFVDSFLAVLEDEVIQNPKRYIEIMDNEEVNKNLLYFACKDNISIRKFMKLINEMNIVSLRQTSLRFIKKYCTNIHISEAKSIIIDKEKIREDGTIGMKASDYKELCFSICRQKKQLEKMDIGTKVAEHGQ